MKRFDLMNMNGRMKSKRDENRCL